MKTTSREVCGLHILPIWNFCSIHWGNYVLVSERLLDANIFILFCWFPDSYVDGLGIVLGCLSPWTTQGTQVLTQGSAFPGKGRYIRVGAQHLRYFEKHQGFINMRRARSWADEGYVHTEKLRLRAVTRADLLRHWLGYSTTPLQCDNKSQSGARGISLVSMLFNFLKTCR